MTTVTFTYNAEHKIIGFESKGHSGYAKLGKDIVCASISVLTINTINSLEKIAKTDCEIITEAKDAYMKCILKSEPTIITDTLLESLKLGIEGIHDNYGSKYLEVFYKED